MSSAFCVHCNFHQPTRANPFAAQAELGSEPGAEPYRNFNEKAAALCYLPNAELGNFNLMSYSVSPGLLAWLAEAAPETHAAIVAADRAARAQAGPGSALALPQHHTILPLARRRDKITQVAWGLASFARAYGRPAEGLWLPEMAVDLETLEVLALLGVRFTLLSQAQVKGAPGGAGPYWVNLGGGQRIAVYVRNDALSNQIAFELPTLGGAGRWARGTLGPNRKSGGRLTLVATDGETFGYHHRGEEHFLHWLLSFEAHATGYAVTTLARDFRENPPQETVEINEFTAWSCPHGQLRRWAAGCACTPGDSGWKSALRRALDSLASRVDEALITEAAALNVQAWPLRDDYIRVALGELAGPDLLAGHGLERLGTAASARVLALLEANFFRQRMYASNGFFYEDLARSEPRYAIANAARAAQLVAQAVEVDLLPALRRDLAMATAASGQTGAQILDEILAGQQA